MARKRHSAEQIIQKLREAEIALGQGKTVAQACKAIEVAEQTYYPQVNLGRHGGTGEPTFVKVASGTTVFNCAQCEANEITS
jgi:outer membrane protein TolC